MSTSQDLRPISLRKEGEEGLAIDWSDGHRSRYAWKHLRRHCPCASCRDDQVKPVDPFQILSAKDLAAPKQLRPIAFTPVGHYAYKITWNDGHDTGIYTLENLRELCQCEECSKASK